MWVFFFHKHSKFRSISLGFKLTKNPLFLKSAILKNFPKILKDFSFYLLEFPSFSPPQNKNWLQPPNFTSKNHIYVKLCWQVPLSSGNKQDFPGYSSQPSKSFPVAADSPFGQQPNSDPAQPQPSPVSVSVSGFGVI